MSGMREQCTNIGGACRASDLQYLLKLLNRVPCATGYAQMGLSTVPVEANASAIDRHAKHGIQPAAQLHQREAHHGMVRL